MNEKASFFEPIDVSTGKPVRLGMQRLWLSGQVLPVGSRLVVQHIFRSQEKEPLEVIYSFPLPRDAAMRAFRVTGEGFEVHSELKPREEAVKFYEQGVSEGWLSTLARQYGDGLVNLTVGNIRPNETVTVCLEMLAGVELRDDGFRFRFPFTLAPAYHAKMRVSDAGVQGELELPSDEFGDVILPPFRKDASSLHEIGFDLSVRHELLNAEIGSPSHAIRVRQESSTAAGIMLAQAHDIPNRDLVIDVRTQTPKVQVFTGPSGNGTRAFAVVVPSTAFGSNQAHPRRVAILLDRSGSSRARRLLKPARQLKHVSQH